jgi:NAD(P)-dependent dehydrogenase (short-subunit alcohol dehydrogenase family)
MDLGISGKSALVCAASKGLGKGCALALAREGAAVTLVARNAQTLEAAAEEIRNATGAASRRCRLTSLRPLGGRPPWQPVPSRTSW